MGRFRTHQVGCIPGSLGFYSTTGFAVNRQWPLLRNIRLTSDSHNENADGTVAVFGHFF